MIGESSNLEKEEGKAPRRFHIGETDSDGQRQEKGGGTFPITIRNETQKGMTAFALNGRP